MIHFSGAGGRPGVAVQVRLAMVPAWFSLPQVIVTLDGRSVEKIRNQPLNRQSQVLMSRLLMFLANIANNVSPDQTAPL